MKAVCIGTSLHYFLKILLLDRCDVQLFVSFTRKKSEFIELKEC